MHSSYVDHLFALARSGRATRRQLLEAGLRLGLASPVILSLLEAAPQPVAAAPAAQTTAPRSGEAAQEVSSGTFVALLTRGAEDIDPHFNYSAVASAVAFAVYEMLLSLKGESTDEFEPGLAASWEVSADQATYTFHLAPDVLFQDGTLANAQAVKDSYTRWIELDGAPVSVITRFCDSPDKMEVVDDLTLRFNLGSPQPLFLSAMASSYGPMVISPTAIAENATEDDPYAHEWAMQYAVGSGPYLLESNSLTDGFVFKRFDDYHRGWAGNHFDELILRVVPEDATRRQLLERGEADAASQNLAVDVVDELRSNPDVQVIEYPSTNVRWTIMNAPRLQTKEVRQGFSYAFPYDDVINAVYKGLMTRCGPLPDTVRGYDPNVFLYETDLDKAKQLILAGGFQEGDVFEFIVDSNQTTELTVAQLFQANVQQMGFELALTAVDFATIESIVRGGSPIEERPHFIGSFGWWPDYNDPWNQLAPSFLRSQISDDGSNSGAWVNERFEELMAQAEHFTSEDELNSLMAEIQNIMTEQDPPAIYSGQLAGFTVFGKDIKGFAPNPLYLECFNFYGMYRETP